MRSLRAAKCTPLSKGWGAATHFEFPDKKETDEKTKSENVRIKPHIFAVFGIKKTRFAQGDRRFFFNLAKLREFTEKSLTGE